METLRVRPIDESAMDEIVGKAGGERAHPDADRRQEPGADYVLGNALIELKALDDEGMSKLERPHRQHIRRCAHDHLRTG
jgi:hypothetical protein